MTQPRAGAGRDVGAEAWERLDLQAIEGAEQLALWSRTDRELHDELIEEARTPFQRELIRRGVASGHTPQEVELFADVIRPLSDAEAYAACTLDATRAAQESFEDRLWAEADPIHGYLLNGYELLPSDPGAPDTLNDLPAIQAPVLATGASGSRPALGAPVAPPMGPLDGRAGPVKTELGDEANQNRLLAGRTASAGQDAFEEQPKRPAPTADLAEDELEEEVDDQVEDEDGDGLHAEPSYRMIPAEGARPQMVYIAPRPPPQVAAIAGRSPAGGLSRPPALSVPLGASPTTGTGSSASALPDRLAGAARSPVPLGASPTAGTGSSASALPERIKLPPGMIVDRPGFPAQPKAKPAPAPEPEAPAPAAAPARKRLPPAPGRYAEDLFNDAAAALGVSFTEQQVDGEGMALERALAHAAAALERGVPVPAIIGQSIGDYRRYVLFLQVQTDSGGRAFELHDPMEQETVWANEADLLSRSELPFADKSNRRITSIALPTPPQ